MNTEHHTKYFNYLYRPNVTILDYFRVHMYSYSKSIQVYGNHQTYLNHLSTIPLGKCVQLTGCLSVWSMKLYARRKLDIIINV